MWFSLWPRASCVGGVRLRAARTTPRSKPRGSRLIVERLEDRLCLDAGDTLATALLTGLGPATGNYVMTREELGDGDFGARDVDLYRIEAQAGQALTATMLPPFPGTFSEWDPYLRLFDAAGNQLRANDDFNSVFPYLEYAFTTSGTHYIGVSGAPNSSYNPNVSGSGRDGSTGAYTLDLGLVTPGPDGIGDTLATAFVTGLGPHKGRFATPGARIGDNQYLGRDVDLYRVDAVAGQTLTARTSLPPDGSYADTVLRLFDAAGTELTLDDDFQDREGFSSLHSYIGYSVPADGTYYVGVSTIFNFNYDPTAPGSGASASAGGYRLDLELEDRGFRAVVVDGSLVIVADKAADLSIDWAGFDTYQIREHNSGTDFILTGVTQDMRVTLSEKVDSLFIAFALVGGDLIVGARGGDDVVFLDFTIVAGSASINLGDGDDLFAMFPSSIHGDLAVFGGPGRDTIFLIGAWVFGSTRIATGDGADRVSLGDPSGFSPQPILFGPATIDLGDGNDHFENYADLRQPSVVRGGDGEDTFVGSNVNIIWDGFEDIL
jgi:hypothetical protein